MEYSPWGVQVKKRVRSRENQKRLRYNNTYSVFRRIFSPSKANEQMGLHVYCKDLGDLNLTSLPASEFKRLFKNVRSRPQATECAMDVFRFINQPSSLFNQFDALHIVSWEPNAACESDLLRITFSSELGLLYAARCEIAFVPVISHFPSTVVKAEIVEGGVCVKIPEVIGLSCRLSARFLLDSKTICGKEYHKYYTTDDSLLVFEKAVVDSVIVLDREKTCIRPNRSIQMAWKVRTDGPPHLFPVFIETQAVSNGIVFHERSGLSISETDSIRIPANVTSPFTVRVTVRTRCALNVKEITLTFDPEPKVVRCEIPGRESMCIRPGKTIPVSVETDPAIGATSSSGCKITRLLELLDGDKVVSSIADVTSTMSELTVPGQVEQQLSVRFTVANCCSSDSKVLPIELDELPVVESLTILSWNGVAPFFPKERISIEWRAKPSSASVTLSLNGVTSLLFGANGRATMEVPIDAGSIVTLQAAAETKCGTGIRRIEVPCHPWSVTPAFLESAGYQNTYGVIRSTFVKEFLHGGFVARDRSTRSGSDVVSKDAVNFGDCACRMGHALIVFSLEAKRMKDRQLPTASPDSIVRSILEAFTRMDVDADLEINGKDTPGFFYRDAFLSRRSRRECDSRWMALGV